MYSSSLPSCLPPLCVNPKKRTMPLDRGDDGGVVANCENSSRDKKRDYKNVSTSGTTKNKNKRRRASEYYGGGREYHPPNSPGPYTSTSALL